MKAKEITLEQLVVGNMQFSVPLYQRTYSWTEKQWGPLWTAVREQAEALLDSDNGPRHFLGSVVLAPGVPLPGGPQRWIIVDGQQRLTTLSLLLCALRDRVHLEDAKLAKQIQEDFLVNRWEHGDDLLKVLPTQTDRISFLACVVGEPDAAGVGNVGEAYRYFQRMIDDYDDPDDPADLHRVFKAIARRLEIVSIAADQDDNVHRIFESLNNTGLELSQADLLRNYLFMLLPTRGQSVYKRFWQPLQDDLGAKDLELLAWLDLIMRGQATVRRDDVYRQQQKRLRHLEHLRDEAAVEAEVAALAERGHLLGLLLHPDREGHPDVRSALKHLAMWDAVTTYPVAMTLLERRHRQTATDSEVAESLTCLESFLVRRMLCGTPTNNLNRILNAAPPELVEGAVVEKLRMYLSRERHYWATDDAVREAIRERNFYWSGRPQQRVFILRRLEQSHDHKEPIDWSRATLSIEHVMPQNLNHAWRRDLAEHISSGQTVREMHGALVHTLGNLTLTGYNSQLSNRPFAEKRLFLRDSGLAMNHAIADRETWGPDEITARADELAERAFTLWPAPIAHPTEPPATPPKWRQLRQILAALPAGTWTTFEQLAELIGSYPGVVARRMKAEAFPHAWRVLNEDGTIPAGFAWVEPGRLDDPVAVLTTEGVLFADGMADSRHLMWAVELADLIGMDTGEPAVPTKSDATVVQAFWAALAQGEYADTVTPLRELVDGWQAIGGELRVDSIDDLSGYLCYGDLAPWIINPEYAYVDVDFHRLKNQPPFVDAAVREEFRVVCSKIPGVIIPPPKVDFRPWFSCEVFSDPYTLEAAHDALKWFVKTASVDTAIPRPANAL